MARREFTRMVRGQIIKRAGAAGFLVCEKCGGLAKQFEIHHIKEDALEIDKSSPLTAEAGMLLCKPCHDELTRPFQTVIAKVKRVEAKHLRATRPKGSIPSRPKAEKEPRPQANGASEIARRFGIT